MHGSFFIVNSLVERKMGFDLGGKGSITEDAYFALMCADRGVKFEWVEGFIREQSPFTLKDLIKQRRRWITGLRLLTLDKAISRKQRAILAVSLTLSHISWLALIATLWNILAGGSYFPPLLTYAATIMTGIMCSMYMIGAYRNITDIELPAHKQIGIWLGTWLLVPVSCCVEGIAVLYSIVRPIRVFEVVDKN
jgi:egghead protein (zeste-white 4 protein)